MNDDDGGSLSLDQVVKRFADSEEALREIGSKIKEIGKLQEDVRVSAGALRESAQAVGDYAEQSRKVASEMADTTRIAGDLLSAARDVIDGTQLERIENLVGEGNNKLDKILSEQAKMRSELVSELDPSEDLEAILESLRRTEDTVNQVTPKVVGELQQRMRSAEDAISAASKRANWMLGGLIVLQIIALALVAFSG